jgi:2-keto-3-deoxy-galactonokinase
MPPGASLTIIGDHELSALYHQALAVHGMDARRLDGEQSAIAGLRLLATRTSRGS